MVDRNTKQFKNGVRIEKREHKSFTTKQVEQVVEDHIRIHPNAYK